MQILQKKSFFNFYLNFIFLRFQSRYELTLTYIYYMHIFTFNLNLSKEYSNLKKFIVFIRYMGGSKPSKSIDLGDPGDIDMLKAKNVTC
jgi:hypothetical protein